MSESERKDFLKDPSRFTSYADEDYELAELVAEDLRSLFDFDIGDIKIGNKGGYLLLLPLVPKGNFKRAEAMNIEKHLGFNVWVCEK